jgi:hypothetical protein
LYFFKQELSRLFGPTKLVPERKFVGVMLYIGLFLVIISRDDRVGTEKEM